MVEGVELQCGHNQDLGRLHRECQTPVSIQNSPTLKTRAEIFMPSTSSRHWVEAAFLYLALMRPLYSSEDDFTSKVADLAYIISQQHSQQLGNECFSLRGGFGNISIASTAAHSLDPLFNPLPYNNIAPSLIVVSLSALRAIPDAW